MLKLIFSLRGILRHRETIIDNSVFTLHYRWSAAILLVFSALVTYRQNFGNPIECISDHPRNDVVDTFCWNEGTFSVPSAWNLTVGSEVPYPGITNSRKNPLDRKYHAYYQWVGLTLFLQAVMFCFPRYVWECGEGGFMGNLTLGLRAIVSNKDQDERVKQVVAYLEASKRHHRYYVYLYIACEIGNFLNVLGQIYFMNMFLGGEIITYSLYTFGLGPSKYAYLSYRVFPKMTQCVFYDFGSTGDVANYGAFCLLSLNVLHEKIYAFLFLWFLLVTLASGAILVFRCLALFSLEFRVSTLSRKSSIGPRTFLCDLCKTLSFDDWFLLCMISKNTFSVHFRSIVRGIPAEEPSSKRYTNFENNIVC